MKINVPWISLISFVIAVCWLRAETTVTDAESSAPQAIEAPVPDIPAPLQVVESEPESEAPPSETVAPPAPSHVPVMKSKGARAYVIPVDGAIDQNRFYILRNGLERAEKEGADLIVLDMDTPGGAVVVTQDMIDLLTSQKIPTYTFVRRNAFSAGAIIAMATDHIYMAPGSVIGDAMPVIMGEGGYANVDDANREKMVSGLDAMVRAIAERKNRDIMVARCMVRRELSYSIGDVEICKEGEILTMTNTEANRHFGDPPRPLLSEGTVDSIEAMLLAAGFEDAVVISHIESKAEQLAGMLQTISPLLLMLFMLGFYIEVNTPGFGLGGILAIVAISLFFLGQHAAGLAGYEEVAILGLGVLLLLVEIFVTPGFGVLGITGLALILGSIFSSMVTQAPVTPEDVSPARFFSPGALIGVGTAFRTMSMAVVGAGISMALLGKYLPKSRFAQSKLVLQESTGREAGYVSSEDPVGISAGDLTVAATDLSPSGKILVDDRPKDAMTSGEFIKAGTSVVVIEVRGNRIVVESVRTEAKDIVS